MRAPLPKSWVGCALLVLLAGCERDPLDVACPEVAPDQLVVTELRGAQAGDTDTLGEWIEVFNGSGHPIDLLGLKVRLSTLDGGSRDEFTVRSSVSVAADAYATLGRFARGEEPAYVDYGYADELDSDLNTTGAVELFACGVEIDQVIYRDLPSAGTLALDGAVEPPDAAANDSEDNFCIDDAAADGAGSPQQENPPCT